MGEAMSLEYWDAGLITAPAQWVKDQQVAAAVEFIMQKVNCIST